jgi:hypothetical protein
MPGPEDDDQDDTLDLTEDMEVQDDDQSADDTADDQSGDDDQERVTFEDEADADQPDDNSVVRTMRQQLRDKDKRIRELEKTSAPAKIDIGDKPTMESCGFDEDEFESQLDAWKERKSAADRQEQSQVEQDREINEAWQQDLSTFEQKKGALAFEDRDDAIDTVAASLDLVQQAVIVKAANNAALFYYALSKSPGKLEELRKIKDPVKMAAAVARMEGAVKVVKGRKAPDPDRPLRGSAQMPGGADKLRDKLEAEADRTGDRTKLQRYDREQRAKNEAK